VCNAQTIGGLCSSMLEGEPSAAHYLYWFSVEISSLPDMFGGMNENFVIATVEGALMMAGDSVILDALQNTAPRVVRIFYPLNAMCEGPCGQCLRSCGAPWATTMW
jgi:hypothetical protein